MERRNACEDFAIQARQGRDDFVFDRGCGALSDLGSD